MGNPPRGDEAMRHAGTSLDLHDEFDSFRPGRFVGGRLTVYSVEKLAPGAGTLLTTQPQRHLFDQE